MENKSHVPNHQPDDDDDDDDHHHHHLDFLGLTLPLFEINMVKSHLHPPGQIVMQNCFTYLKMAILPGYVEDC
jgi:hypothetical protein